MKPWVSRGRLLWAAPGLLASAGFCLRIYPFLRLGTWGQQVDYDEGVYFSAAALLWRALRPYRDFTFVHPPGLLEFLAVTSAWASSPALGFVVSRWVAAFLGLGSMLCLAALLGAQSKWVGAMVAVGVYALFPEAVGTERGPFLEPLLNCLCLFGAALWLGKSGSSHKIRAAWAGLFFGLALAVKFWAAVWIVAALASVLERERRVAIGVFLAAALVGFVAAVAPLAVGHPCEFVRQTLLFQLQRPADGPPMGARIVSIFNAKHLAPALLTAALLAAPSISWGARREARFFGIVFALLVGLFLVSPAYFSQYSAHLAAPWAALAGLAAQDGWELTHKKTLVRTCLAGLFFLALFPAVKKCLRETHEPSGLLSLRTEVQARAAPGECVLSFEPAWLLVTGRLPGPKGLAVEVDSYASLLRAAAQGGRRYTSVEEAFHGQNAQRAIHRALSECRMVLVGSRARRVMSQETWVGFQRHFARTWNTDNSEVEIWERI